LGQPLIHRGEVLGVLAVFARGTIGSECMGWLRMIADHAAAAIVTARAFAEIESLKKKLELENEYLREEVAGTGMFGELVGQSPALETVTRQIDLVAPTDSTVLILGESGTGKELVAREIHRRSKRANKPLIKVNCAAVPRELYESEFFGHAGGAFTGALRDRVGRFELAEGGTLFLDEIGEIPLELQAKLLRVLQEGELERVGEERTGWSNTSIDRARRWSLVRRTPWTAAPRAPRRCDGVNTERARVDKPPWDLHYSPMQYRCVLLRRMISLPTRAGEASIWASSLLVARTLISGASARTRVVPSRSVK
jgi:sigma-54 interacting transcriptional regulator